jgi:hypothetical protein
MPRRGSNIAENQPAFLHDPLRRFSRIDSRRADIIIAFDEAAAARPCRR